MGRKRHRSTDGGGRGAFLVAGALLACCLAPIPAAGNAAVAVPPGQDAFSYGVREGESLTDIARMFRVAPDELISLNRIADPHRLRLGQALLIPNAFARDAAALRNERAGLLQANQALEGKVAAHHETVKNLENRIGELGRETAGLEGQIAVSAHWERAAQGLAIALFAFGVWIVKLGSDRARLARRLKSVTTENATLARAQQTYREAAGHLELRYQKLYGDKGGPPRKKVVAEGLAKLDRAFYAGAREIESYVADAKGEREREEQLIEAQQKTLGWLFHPVREVLARTRLRERTS